MEELGTETGWRVVVMLKDCDGEGKLLYYLKAYISFFSRYILAMKSNGAFPFQ